MAAALIVAALLVVGVLLAVGHVLSGRPENHINPRRRELRRAHAVRRRAELTVHEVRETLDRYQSVLVDPVAESLVADVRDLLRRHDRETQELDQ